MRGRNGITQCTNRLALAYKGLKEDFPLYVAGAEDVDPSYDPLVFWKEHESTLPTWSQAARQVLLVQPSSAASERVFSLLRNSFGERQHSHDVMFLTPDYTGCTVIKFHAYFTPTGNGLFLITVHVYTLVSPPPSHPDKTVSSTPNLLRILRAFSFWLHLCDQGEIGDNGDAAQLVWGGCMIGQGGQKMERKKRR